MKNWFYETLHPEIYHGNHHSSPFFEGWYYRLINASEDKRYAIIPGIFLGPNNPHAFIQVLEGHTRRTAYHVFPLEQFQANPKRFEVHIGSSTFKLDRINLALDRSEPLGDLHGELSFEQVKPWPVKWISPGIMGWFAWIPFMECYHGVLSFDHSLHGELNIEGRNISFDGGRGYIEKDWGRSFPSGYIWFQSNHFDIAGISLTASIAMILWLGRAFRGFIIGLWINGILYRFATYTGARTERLSLNDGRVEWEVSDRRFKLELQVAQSEGGWIYGPTPQDMGRRVDETMDASIHIRLSEINGKVLYEGNGRHAGLEINGDMTQLLAR